MQAYGHDSDWSAPDVTCFIFRRQATDYTNNTVAAHWSTLRRFDIIELQYIELLDDLQWYDTRQLIGTQRPGILVGKLWLTTVVTLQSKLAGDLLLLTQKHDPVTISDGHLMTNPAGCSAWPLYLYNEAISVAFNSVGQVTVPYKKDSRLTSLL